MCPEGGFTGFSECPDEWDRKRFRNEFNVIKDAEKKRLFLLSIFAVNALKKTVIHLKNR